MMGGRIWLESELGKGSTFHFTVALERASTTTTQTEAAFDGARGLVVYDNGTNRLIVDKLITKWGLKVTQADSGEQALVALKQAREAGEDFHVMLLDVMMPGMDGFAVVEQVRANADLAATTIMMLSSADSNQASARCRELGIELFLSKPVKQRQLRSTMLRALGSVVKSAVQQVASAEPAAVRHVLLAEDNPLNQRIALARLKKWGYTVDAVDNVRKAVEAAASGTYDVILMDATQAIRVHEAAEGGHVPIIALTAHAMKGDRERFLEAGMDCYVSKPIRPDELLATIDAVLNPGNAPSHFPCCRSNSDVSDWRPLRGSCESCSIPTPTTKWTISSPWFMPSCRRSAFVSSTDSASKTGTGFSRGLSAVCHRHRNRCQAPRPSI
jgi:CheY-like chemotaxis protein